MREQLVLVGARYALLCAAARDRGRAARKQGADPVAAQRLDIRVEEAALVQGACDARLVFHPGEATCGVLPDRGRPSHGLRCPSARGVGSVCWLVELVGARATFELWSARVSPSMCHRARRERSISLSFFRLDATDH